MSGYLNFSFNVKDPKFKSELVVVNDSPTNYIAHSFISTPIYDNFDVEVGYKVSDDYIQQVDVDKYMVRISSTYYFTGTGGTISWQYSFINTTPSYFYPIGILASSNITSTTGIYFGKTGVVSLMPLIDGTRNVTIGFNF